MTWMSLDTRASQPSTPCANTTGRSEQASALEAEIEALEAKLAAPPPPDED